MVKVITYGTYDMLHHGHVRLLERAKALGDYLVVGVTSEDFDISRGKINVRQSLMERIEAVRATGLADEIIVEEYAGQKIDDIRNYDIDIFTVGSDWEGYFDYLNEWCSVVYLDRTEGVSSSEIRSQKRKVRLGIVADNAFAEKFLKECAFVNGMTVSGVLVEPGEWSPESLEVMRGSDEGMGHLMDASDAVAVLIKPERRGQVVRAALQRGKHVLCESPMALSTREYAELVELAKQKQLVLQEGLKTAYITGYNRFLRLLQSGRIGKVLAVDCSCTTLAERPSGASANYSNLWNSISDWGPTAMLPVFQLLGTEYTQKQIISLMDDAESKYDALTRINFIYPEATASIKVAKGAKSEGSLVVTGTDGYGYVPAPWWKTDYFEMRFENPADNKRFFYQLEGEGIRNELVAFARAIENEREVPVIDEAVGRSIVQVIEDYYAGRDLTLLV